MRKHFFLILIVCVLPFPLNAQRGSAPSGYYPSNYSGTIFTGTLESATFTTQEMTLVYTKRDKTERFLGRLDSTCGWKDRDGTPHSFRGSDIPKGTLLTAFYNTVNKKVNGEKTSENVVFAISYVEMNGEKIPEEKRLVIRCSGDTHVVFKAY